MARSKSTHSGAAVPPNMQNIEHIFDNAQQHHAGGRLSEAEKGYRAILQQNPKHAPALHFLGVLAMASGKFKNAADLIKKAIAAQPDYVEAHSNLGNALQQQGKTKPALASYRKAIAIDPAYAVAHMNLGTTLLGSGDLDGAIESLGHATTLEPDYGAAQRNLGSALRQSGRLDEAIVAYEKVAALNPDDPAVINDLGVLLEERGRLADAIGQYRRSVTLNPGDAGSQLNLGRVLEAANKLAEALSCYQRAISIRPDYVAAHYNAGNLLAKMNRPDDAANAYKAALEIEPGYADARIAYDALLTKPVSFWHFPMMNDAARNDAFEGALKAAVKPNSVVLDIGSGSGLLALMAARAGAARVDTVEVVPAIADIARNIIDRNGYGDKITVHNKLSTALEIGDELPQKANVLVTETFDVGVLGEHVVRTIKHARANLLTDDAVIIPARAEVIGVLLESAEIRKLAKVEDVSGFDLSPFNRFRKPYHQLSLSHYAHTALSDDFAIFGFDFTGDAIEPETRPLSVPATGTGTCHAIAFWFRLILDEDHSYDTGADKNAGNHWEQAVHILDVPMAVEAGGDVNFTASHNNRMITFGFDSA
jgi:tetratricopeptide (TPR) repeat protein